MRVVVTIPPGWRAALLDGDREARLRAIADEVDDPSDAEIALTGWGSPLLDPEEHPELRLVVHAAGSVRGVVPDALWERGVRVVTAADANAVPVAEYTVAMVLLSGKHVLAAAEEFRRTRTHLPAWPTTSHGNYRRVVGVIGASRVGRRVLDLLRGYDVTLLVHDPYLSDEAGAALGAELVELDELLARSETVTLHAPDLPETRGILDRRRLALMRDGAVLINTARGVLVDHDALTDELVSGRLRAVLDVTDPEPLPADSPLWDCPHVTITPHLSGSQGNELARMADLALDELERWSRGEPLQHELLHADLARMA
jgi:phosphoglycerate dehydrogenase-like enzyme